VRRRSAVTVIVRRLPLCAHIDSRNTPGQTANGGCRTRLAEHDHSHQTRLKMRGPTRQSLSLGRPPPSPEGWAPHPVVLPHRSPRMVSRTIRGCPRRNQPGPARGCPLGHRNLAVHLSPLRCSPAVGHPENPATRQAQPQRNSMWRTAGNRRQARTARERSGGAEGAAEDGTRASGDELRGQPPPPLPWATTDESRPPGPS
jgi:hypothetical protein